MHSRLINVLKRLRSFGTFWIAPQTLHHLEALRQAELEKVLALLPREGDLLEIGAGTGWQANALESQGYRVEAIDLPCSGYAAHRVREIMDYDGKRIPFPDNSFDILFSSSVLEHVKEIEPFQKELHRVLKPTGTAVHVLPASTWRFWTSITHALKHWTWPKPHGEHARSVFHEMAVFSRSHWQRHFQKAGWRIETVAGNGLFYTGCSIMGARISLDRRRALAKMLGSACTIFVLSHHDDHAPR